MTTVAQRNPYRAFSDTKGPGAGAEAAWRRDGSPHGTMDPDT